jgi:hypothetical protein
MKETLVKEFLKGVFNRRPPVKDPLPTWDLNLVLNALVEAPYEPIDKASLGDLTLKTAFLIAITSARRGCEIQALDVREEWCRIKPIGAYLRHNPFFIPKVRTEANINASINLPRLFPNPKNRSEKLFQPMCVVRALEAYIKATAPIRKTEQLFVLHGGGPDQGKPASKATIARWLTQTISRAYEHFGKVPPKHLNAHSTRGMATSVASKWNVSFAEIARAACWATETSFIKHYRLDLSGDKDFLVGNAIYAEQISNSK